MKCRLRISPVMLRRRAIDGGFDCHVTMIATADGILRSMRKSRMYGSTFFLGKTGGFIKKPGRI